MKPWPGKTFTLPIAVDVEDNKLKPLCPPTPSTDLVIAAADAIESWGLYAHACTPTPIYSQTELSMDRLAAYDLWIADYRSKRPHPQTRDVAVHQHRAAGRHRRQRGHLPRLQGLPVHHRPCRPDHACGG